MFTRTHLKLSLIIASTLAIILLSGLAFLVFVPPPWPGNAGPLEVKISDGQGVAAIADTLKERGLVRSRMVFIAYAVLTGNEGKLKAGTYVFTGPERVSQIVEKMALGLSKSDDIEVTIPEGFNIWEVDKELTSAGLILEGQLARNYEFKEGHLFPDTYRFKKDATLEDIVRKMEANFLEKAAVGADIILIIASILEKEAKTKEDMELVAGIIEKRLEIGMGLQIDATVAYGWCLRRMAEKTSLTHCDVTQAPIASELKVDGPYNTYSRRGLPQGAISNPGLSALTAASNPKASEYLYYLSTRDGSQVIYSKTLSEHNANRRKHLGL